MRLIDADALIVSECGQCDGACDNCDGEYCLKCNSHNKCQLREAVDDAPTINAEFVRHEGTTTFITTNDLDKYQTRIIVDEGEKSKFCRVFYEDDRTHGRWIRKTGRGLYWWECSECGEKPLKNHYTFNCFSDYCPNCGARMDAEVDEDANN